MFEDIPTRSSLWGDVKHSSQIFCIEPLNSLSMVWSDMSPYPRREEQQGDRRAQTAGNTHICIQHSQALGACELQESLQGVGWHRCFWHSFSVWLPCALHRAGPSGCKFSARFRLGGFRICLRQMSVCPTAPVASCWLASPALAFARRWFAVLRQGRVAQHEAACSTARVFSRSSSSMAQLLLYAISKASHPPEERPDPVDGLQSHTCGLPLPSPVPAKRMGCRWPTWCQKLLLATTWHAGFHPGEVSIWASLHLVVVLAACV